MNDNVKGKAARIRTAGFVVGKCSPDNRSMASSDQGGADEERRRGTTLVERTSQRHQPSAGGRPHGHERTDRAEI